MIIYFHEFIEFEIYKHIGCVLQFTFIVLASLLTNSI